jgi:hypothetical protein
VGRSLFHHPTMGRDQADAGALKSVALSTRLEMIARVIG